MNDTATIEKPATESDGWEWAIVEIYGHRKHVGRVREVERVGVKMLRVDVPIKGDAAANGWETHFYGGASIFSFTLTDEASAVQANKPYDAAARYRLPAPTSEEFDPFGGLDEDELPFDDGEELEKDDHL